MSEKWPIRRVSFAVTMLDLTSLCRSNRNWHSLVEMYYDTRSTLLTLYLLITTYFGHYWLPLMGGTISSSRKMPSSERTETWSCSKIIKSSGTKCHICLLWPNKGSKHHEYNNKDEYISLNRKTCNKEKKQEKNEEINW